MYGLSPIVESWYHRLRTLWCHCLLYTSKDTLGDVFASHHKKIVAYLSVLNDCLIMEFNASGNRDFVSFLTKFAGDHHLEGASFEGRCV